MKIKKQMIIDTLPEQKIIAFRNIAARFGTPAYVYFEEDLRDNLRTFLDIPAPFGLVVRYAVKANPTSAILRVFNNMGAYFDASTFNECIRIIKAAGIDGKKIRLTSQEVQSTKNLTLLAKEGVQYTACSLLQLESYGKALPNTTVGIRFNVGIGSGWNPRNSTGGINSSFGIYEQYKEIDALLHKYNLTLTTILLHIGSGSDSEKQKKAILKGLELVTKYPSVTSLDMGGGFKVALMQDEHSTDINDMGHTMSNALQHFEKETGRKITLEVEPGKALVANTGYILTEIIDKVHTGEKGRAFIKVNGGMNMNARIAMYGAQHPMIVLPQQETRQIKKYVVTGICCESGDILTVKPNEPDYSEPRQMLEATIGDLFVIGGTGAYCSAMATLNYNSQQIHPEILVRANGKFDLIRTRQQLKKLWEDERIPEDLRFV